MPSGKIRWFDATKGFGFIDGDQGEKVFVHQTALPANEKNPAPGTRVEYSVADSKRGPQALAVKIVAPAPSIAKNLRRSASQMVPLIEDLIKVLDASSETLRRGRYPENGSQVAKMLRVVADEFDA